MEGITRTRGLPLSRSQSDAIQESADLDIEVYMVIEV